MPIAYMRFIYGESVVGILLFAPILAAFHFRAVRRSRSLGQKPPLPHLAAAYIFCIMLLAMLAVTGLTGISRFELGRSTINFKPFDIWAARPAQYYQNALLFMPFGLMLPLLWRRYQKLWRTAAAGLALSALIETVQLFTSRAADVDDLMMNTLGAALGYALYALLRRIRPEISSLSVEHDAFWKRELTLCVAGTWAVALLATSVLEALKQFF